MKDIAEFQHWLNTTNVKVYAVGHECFSRPGPRLVDGVEQLAALLHGTECFSEAAVEAMVGDALRLVVGARTASPPQKAISSRVAVTKFIKCIIIRIAALD